LNAVVNLEHLGTFMWVQLSGMLLMNETVQVLMTYSDCRVLPDHIGWRANAVLGNLGKQYEACKDKKLNLIRIHSVDHSLYLANLDPDVLEAILRAIASLTRSRW